MDEGEFAADVDGAGRGVRHRDRGHGQDGRVLGGHGDAGGLPRRDHDEDAQNADPSSHHLLHHYRLEWLG